MDPLPFIILAIALLAAYLIGYRGGRRDCPACSVLDKRVEGLEIALEDIRVEAEHPNGDIHWIGHRADAALTPGNVSEHDLYLTSSRYLIVKEAE